MGSDNRQKMSFEVTSRPQRGGKLTEMAEAIAKRCGLPSSTCADLLRHRWVYTEYSDQPSRWEHPGPDIVKPKPDVVGLSDQQWARIINEGSQWLV